MYQTSLSSPSSNLRLPIPKPSIEPTMESGSNREESKAAAAAAAGDDGVAASPGQEEEAAAMAAAAAGEEDQAAVSPPAPAATSSSPKPYYECVFCKRGFTTAQALGGHMNIHRRDRAKPAGRDSLAGGGVAAAVSRGVECYNKYRHLVAYPATYPAAAAATPTATPIAAAAAGSSSFSMHYPAAMGSAAPATTGLDAEGVLSPSSVSPRELSLFGEAARDHDLHLGLGRHRGIVAGEGSRAPPERPERPAGEPERAELDLELRLGRRPRH
ncbi:hypothetical protein ACP4OV_016413 [Aristida adscensionis]